MTDSDVKNRVREIQAEMLESAKSCFDDWELAHLRAVIRLTVEFRHYLEYGSTEMARGLRQAPTARYLASLDAKYLSKLDAASSDLFNKYDLDYLCESIRSGIDSFFALNISCRTEGATGSNVNWGIVLSRESFKEQFVSMFDAFVAESVFEKKCRLLLDLFKLQIVFLGFSYE